MSVLASCSGVGKASQSCVADLNTGDTVAVFMENCPEFVCTWLGLAKAGLVPALINYNLRAESLHHSVTVAGSCALVYSASLAAAVSEIFSLLLNGQRLSYPTYITGAAASADSLVRVPGTKDLDELAENTQ